MKILLMTTHLDIGGVAVYTVSLATQLARRSNSVIVVSSGGSMEQALSKEGIKHIKIDIRTKSELSPKLWLNFFRLKGIVESERPDLIHAQTRVAQVLAHALSGILGIPYISTCHGFFKKRLSRVLFGCWGQSVIAISEAVKNHLIKDFGVEENRVELIHNGIDIKRFSRGFSEEEVLETKKSLGVEAESVIGAIGRLSPVKGFEDLINSFSEVSALKKNAKLAIVGSGPDKEKLFRLTKDLNIADKVKFIESNPDTPKLLCIMDVFVFPSVQEGLGLSLAEAMASGRPVIATDVGGIGSLVRHNQTGILVTKGDRKGLADAIKRLLDDKELRDRLAENGRALITKEFSLDEMVDKTEGLYKKITATKKNRNAEIERILIVNVNWLGDVLFSTPFIRAIRKKFPAGYIACMAVPRVKPVLELNPHLDEIIVYDEDGAHRSILGKLRFMRTLRSKKFDAAILLHRSFTRRFIAFLSGIKRRVGYSLKMGGLFLTDAVIPPKNDIHKIDYFLNLGSSLGIDINDKTCDFFVSDNDRRSVRRILAEEEIFDNNKLVVMNPGGNWNPKRWPKEKFARLADSLIKELKVKLVISGADKDYDLAKSIKSYMKEKPAILCGRLSLKELGALLEWANLVISNDSGPLHIAVSMKSPAIALFGPTSSKMTGPYGRGKYIVISKDIGCEIPCYNLSCGNNRCMDAITPEEVFEEAKKLLT